MLLATLLVTSIFNFTLAQDSQTSAGVFRVSDGVLIRTLWSNVAYDAGTHPGSWDGDDDEGDPAPPAEYEVRVLSSQATYTWQGVVGNTSSEFTGSTVHNQQDVIRSMVIVGSTIYFAVGYNEQHHTQMKTAVSTPQQRTELGIANGLFTYFVDSDGTNVYWGGFQTEDQSMVMATKVSDDTEVTFSGGSSYLALYAYPDHTYSVIDLQQDVPGAKTTGLAVQKTSGFVFIANGGLDRIAVANKTTGAIVRAETSLDNPGALACDDDNDVWVISGAVGSRTVKEFSVDGSGNFTLLQTITPFEDPLALAISADGSLVIVADGGDSQQVKAYNTSDISSAWTFGEAGGQANGPAVENDRFYFMSTSLFGSTVLVGKMETAVLAFAPDGTFWLGDPGNRRTMHFSAARALLETVHYAGAFYSCRVDGNDPTRAFIEYLEYAVDYSKTLAPDNGSWTLVRNWGWGYKLGLTGTWHPDYSVLRDVTTLSNGRTYAFLGKTTTGDGLFELVPSSGLRYIQDLGGYGDKKYLYPDGSLRQASVVPDDGTGTQTITKYNLTGFDGSNNPTWDAGTTIASWPAGSLDPANWSVGGVQNRDGQTTTSGLVVSFDSAGDSVSYSHSARYHLGAVALGGNSWKWRTADSIKHGATYEECLGVTFPTDGTYELGCFVVNPGGPLLVRGNHIFWNYRGENWHGSQTNYWQHVNDDGLMVGQFGTDSWQLGAGSPPAPAGMAGNILSANIVLGTDSNVYIYQNDEFHHSGMHRWRIDGLDTVSEQVVVAIAGQSVGGPLVMAGPGRMQ